MSTKGYIYLRTHESYDKYDAFKLGKTDNITSREGNYITGEIVRGNFIFVLELDSKEISDNCENLLKKQFEKYNINKGGGTEFFNKEIKDLIKPFLESKKINYRQLNENEINEFIRKYYEKNNSSCDLIDSDTTETDLTDSDTIETDSNITKSNNYELRDYQSEIINKLIEHYKTEDKALLNLTCGVGKTIISIWTILKCDFKKVVIGVPNKLLLKQWKNKILSITNNYKLLLVKGGIEEHKINDFLQQNNRFIIITTFNSSYKIRNTNYTFDIKINDECHHLTSTNLTEDETKKYEEMLKIKSNKQLSLTATIKNVDCENPELNIVSNSDEKYFGKTIETKNLKWAIDKQIVCDYNIQTILGDENYINELFVKFKINNVNDKRLFLGAYSALKSIQNGHSHHLLVYVNNMDNSIKINDFINKLKTNNFNELNDKLFSAYYNSEMKPKEQIEILKEYNEASNGIISCVYCLGEGYDNPKIDGVVFVENMSSNIRIVQSALRAGRKNEKEPNKKTKIILPILSEKYLSDENNDDMKKIREVIKQIGLEDETIMTKIKVFKFGNINNDSIGNEKEKLKIENNNYGTIDEELNNKIKLLTIPRELIVNYKKAKEIIKYKLKNKSKKGYYELCESDVRLPKEPEEIFKNKFDWIDYLSIERKYYDIDECKEKVNGYIKMYSELKSYYSDLLILCNELCKLDDKFPPNDLWIEYYKINSLGHIINMDIKRRKKGVNIFL